MIHKHHIVPKYEGGSDYVENLVELTVTQHAMWHFAEWQRKGDWRDKLAWQGLAGIVSHEEAIREAIVRGARAPKPNRKSSTKEGNERRKQAMLGLVRTEEDKKRKSVAAYARWEKPGAKDHMCKDTLWHERLKDVVWTRSTAAELALKYNVTGRCIRHWRRRLR